MMLLDGHTELGFGNCKVGCILPMVIWSEFRMGQYWDDDYREDALQFTILHLILSFKRLYFSMDYLNTHNIFQAYLSAKSKIW